MRVDSDYTVNVPLALLGQVDAPTLHLRVDDGAAFVAGIDDLPWKRIREVTLPGLEDFAGLQKYHNRCHWNLRWQGFDVQLLLDNQRRLRRRNVTVVVASDDPDLYDKLVVGESMSLQMAVPMGDPDAVDLAALNRLVSYVLITGASRPVRIEPLVSMVKTCAGKERVTLWDHSRERARHDLWVDDDGRVGLSARLLSTQAYTTLADLDDADLSGSEAYRQLDDYAEKQFRDQSECSSCQTFPLCGGWLRYVDPAYDCEVWQLVLNGLAEAVGEGERAQALARGPGQQSGQRRA